MSTKNASSGETALISQADERGYFGTYGGVFIAETLMEPVRDADSAFRVGRVADAVVVGSAVVQRIGENASDKNAMLSEISQFVSGLREAMDSVSQ